MNVLANLATARQRLIETEADLRDCEDHLVKLVRKTHQAREDWEKALQAFDANYAVRV